MNFFEFWNQYKWRIISVLFAIVFAAFLFCFFNTLNSNHSFTIKFVKLVFSKARNRVDDFIDVHRISSLLLFGRYSIAEVH